jgi:hypothetical protein
MAAIEVGEGGERRAKVEKTRRAQDKFLGS